MKELTDFQRRCEAELATVLRSLGTSLTNRKVAGQSEQYVQAEVGHFSVWIYEDEAGIQGDGIDQRFERPDYDSPDELCRAFLAAIAGLIKKS